MNKLILLFAASLASLSISAQTPTDSIPSMQLDEIVIEAPKVIRKADMDVYHPSKSAVDNSKNGLQLLNNLMIPSLSVNEPLGVIQAAGENVQLRINGRKASLQDVKALLPETIKRVEWIDNPGLRYGGVPYVVNFIVSNPTTGGSLMANARPALNMKWGNYMADAKFNTGLSQWQVGADFKLTDDLKAHRDYSETFTYPDGTSLTRTESPRSGSLSNTFLNAWLSYNYINPNKTVFVADLTFDRDFNIDHRYNGILSLSDGSDDIFLTDAHGDHGSTPGISLYWQQNFGRNHTLVVNAAGAFYFGRSFSDYIEQTPDLSSTLTDVHTDIQDRNQAYAIEADYIRNWRNSRFTAGISYNANRNRSVYHNLDDQVFHQRQDRVYFYAEYFQRIGSRFTATAGLGAQYTDFLFRESGRGNHSWSLRPQATITYSINQNHKLHLNFTTWQNAPSLAETNVVPQQLDGFQWRVGNQDLKTSNSYRLTLRYSFTLPRVSGSFGVNAFTSPNAITPILYWQDDRLITSYENSRGLQNLTFFLAPQIEIIPNWVTLSGIVQYRMERMRGTGYTHLHNSWSGNATLAITHWGFILSGQYMRSQRNLWGEKITWGEDINIIDLTYNWKEWQFGAGIIMPFGKYDQGSKSLSRWNSNEQHMRINMRVPYISISYNLQWGKQKRAVRKITDIDAAADRSTTAPR